MRLVDGDELLRKWNELSIRGRTEFDQVIMSEPTVDAIISTELRKHMSDFSDLETECVPDECEGCEWLNIFNLMCNKTYESLLNGCVCTKRFTN